MPKFLNTQGLSTWIPRIIEETERELVIITPYMQLSDKIFRLLVEAENRGVETIIVYRENKLSEKDKEKLKSIDNLNLMHHPNVHAKCYYNENYLLIASMNLYEYSELNNREMGVLLHRKPLEDVEEDNFHFGRNYDSPQVFEEALKEIVEIINGAHLEKKSRETIEEGFEMEILKSRKEKAEESLKRLNKVFVHKKFEIESDENYRYIGYICKSYMDKVDVKIAGRIEISMRLDERKLEKAFNDFQNNRDKMEYSIKGFKLYWNKFDELLLYDDSKHHYWQKVITDTHPIQLRKKGIDEVIEFIKSF